MKFRTLLFALILFWSTQTEAEEWNSKNWDGFVAMRIGTFSGVENINGEAPIYQLAAIQLGIYTAEKWSSEFEVEGLIHNTGGGGFSLTGRFGRTFQLIGPDPWQSGLKTYFVPLIGYQYSERPIHGTADYTALSYTAHVIEGALALDFNWGRSGGFSFRVFSAFDFALSTEKHDSLDWAYANFEPMRWSVKAGVKIGYNFGFGFVDGPHSADD